MEETNRGLLVRNWAPQLEILSHDSIGGFLSHCGWNSVLESLSQGVPIIGWPLAAEQAFNSKLLVEEMGVAVELTRGAGGELGRERVKEVVEMVMGKNEKAEEMKRKVVDLSEHMRAAIRDDGEKKKKEEEKGSSVRAMDDFVATIFRKL
ncbi:unnamed protein product [Linum trigynum]|uniref:anthocyanidin 3-O-glucosyltransferase n=1 Tax=Linum trigynum TaxID=586398 RepID=A0AAV2D2Z1_9ROSI